MATDDDLPEDAEEKPKGRLRKLTLEESLARGLRLEREAAELRSALASGDLSSLMTRVAWVLNEYPHTRDSDIALTIKYWEQYQPTVYKPTGMMPRDLFSLERTTHITRVRAKIQNEYGLFPASGEVKRHRRKLEEEVSEAMVEDKPGRRVVWVYADETGKNQPVISVAAVWVMKGSSLWPILKAISAWRDASKFGTREIHFTELRKGDVEKIRTYLDTVLAKRELLSFKAISIDKASTRRPIEEVVQRLHEFMVVRGMEHEIRSGRIDVPHEVSLTVDAEHSLDDIARADIRNRIAASLKLAHGDSVTIAAVEAADSKTSETVQLADLIAGSINRRLNHAEARNYKDEIADMVIEKLSLQLAPGELPDVDSTAWLLI